MGAENAQTDREFIFQLQGEILKSNAEQGAKMHELSSNIARLTHAIEKLDNGRIEPLEDRVTEVERWQSKWAGVAMALSGMAIALSVIASIITLIH